MSIIYRPTGRAAEYAHLAINIYNGCAHGCTYCYVPDVLHRDRGDFHKSPTVRDGLFAKLHKEARRYAGTDERVLLCFACDPYQPVDREKQSTRDVIKILRGYDIPFQILTKGGMWAVPDFDLYGPHDAFAATLTLLDTKESTEWEPNAPKPANRIRAIELAKQQGITTWVSLEPVIEPKVSLEIIRRTHHIVDHYKIGKMNYQKQDLSWQTWRKFGQQAIALCREFGVDYYIKADLTKYLDGIPFCNVDTRKVKRAKIKTTLF